MKISFDIPDNSQALITTLAVTVLMDEKICFTMTTKTIGTEALKDGAIFTVSRDDAQKKEEV